MSGAPEAAGARCYLCAGPGHGVYGNVTDPTGCAAGSWTIAACRRCDLFWLHPALPAARFSEAYGAGYYTHCAAREPAAAPTWAKPVLARRYGYAVGAAPLLPRLFGRAGICADSASSLVRYLPARAGGHLLDVGCGNGEFLRLMRELGWHVTGVEPDARAVAAASGAIRAALHCGSLETVPLPAGSFDAITLHHVIEHVPDPIHTLALCRALLRRGGRIVVLTPNAASLGRHIFGRAWLHWDPPRHSFVFTQRSLQLVAERAGLRVEELRTTARAARWTWQESRRRARADQRPRAEPGRARGAAAASFQILEHALLPARPLGEELVLVAGGSPPA